MVLIQTPSVVPVEKPCCQFEPVSEKVFVINDPSADSCPHESLVYPEQTIGSGL